MAPLLNLIARLLLGAGAAFALPPFSQLWLWGVCLSGLLLLDTARAAASKKAVFAHGFVFGLGYFVTALHWIGVAFFVDAKTDLWMMPFAVGGLAAAMAVYWGLAALVTDVLVRRGWSRFLVWPAIMTIAEYLRGILFTGFPWAAPGQIADGSDAVLQLASLFGMHGLTLLALLWGTAPAALFLARKKRRSALGVPLVVLATLASGWVWGTWRLTANPPAQSDGPLVRLVQPNVPQSDKWRESNGPAMLDDLLALSTEPGTGSAKPALIVWPEAALPFLLDESRAALDQISGLLKPGQLLLTGAIRRDVPQTDARYFTSILGVAAGGEIFDRYDKFHLVPGGEYLPLSGILEPLGFRKLVAIPEGFSAGDGPRLMMLPGIGLAAPLICYEAIFPVTTQSDRERARLIVTVTNDGWFGKSSGPYQHLAQARLRAVEQGLPVIRAANTGISAVIDPLGRYVSESVLGTRGFVEASLPDAVAPPPFARAGLVPAILLLVLCLIAAAFGVGKFHAAN